MGALKGDLIGTKGLNKRLRALPISIAHNIAHRAAPMLTTLAVEAHQARRSVYGESRPAGADGEILDLVVTGDTARDLRFVANGTVVRAVLGTRYAKYLIGKYGMLPNGAIPVSWSDALKDLVATYKVTL
jgi:hypothetical protein